MKLYKSLGLAAVLVLAGVGVARAGFISINTSITNTGDVAAVADVPHGALGITAPATDLPEFDLYGQINSDPDLMITEKILNNTAQTWDSFTVTLNPGPSYFVTNLVGDAPSGSVPNYLPHWSTSLDGLSLTFDGGYVQPGQTLYAVFDFTITDVDGGFSYHVINSPHAVPEPAALAMVGLGAALLLRRRR
jgi:hypothetical protein